ncbi:MAG TPA: hypothetical protein VFE19_04105 [Jatrophihabitantaceae bacterium]|nr:hypothetical protein [Jatrophihabitantaceae bacterium]
MTAADGIKPKRFSKFKLWVAMALVGAIGISTALAVDVATGSSVRSGLMLAFTGALIFVAYQLGYREGRRDYEPAHPISSVPPPKQR